MLTADELRSLEVGDLVETHPLFKGLSLEPVILRVAEVLASEVVFVATWFGVTIGRWRASPGEDGASKWVFK